MYFCVSMCVYVNVYIYIYTHTLLLCIYIYIHITQDRMEWEGIWLVSKDSSLKCYSRPWGFEFLHAYVSLEQRWTYKLLLPLGLDFTSMSSRLPK